MGLLSSLFGSSNKNSTTNTTHATQNTNNVSADAGSILAGDGTSVFVDSSEDYRYTDSRDMSTYTSLVENNDSHDVLTSNSNNLALKLGVQTTTTNTTTNNTDNSTDARSWSEVHYDVVPDAVKQALDFVDAADMRRSADAALAIGGAYNNSLEFFDLSATAMRDGYEKYAEVLADTTVRTINAVETSNRSDGEALISTFNQWGKYAALLIGGAILVGFLRRA